MYNGTGVKMHIVVLAAMAATMLFLGDGAWAWEVPAWMVGVAGAGYLVVTAVLSHSGSVWGLRAMASGAESDRRATRRRAMLAVATRVWLIAGLAGLIMLGYGRWVMSGLRLGSWPLVGKAVVVAPFIVALLLNWLLEYPLHRASRRRLAESAVANGRRVPPGWTLGQFLGNNIRHQLLFIVAPIAIIVLLADVLDLYVYPMLPAATADYVVSAATIVCVCVVFLCVPFLIVRIWRTERLGDGPLRRDLEAVCRRLGLRFREILVWKSGGVIANAGVVGLLPAARYVLLSDALLADMSERHVRAIFAHEAGHIKHRHILFAVLFVLVAVAFSTIAAETIMVLVSLSIWHGEVLAMAFVAASFALGFGWVSRRFERQSDVMAAWVSSWDDHAPGEPDDTVTPEGAAVFATAIERVAYLNGMQARAGNWRHGSVAWRLSYIRWLGSRGGSRCEIDRFIRRMKTAMLLALAVVGALAAWRMHPGV